jgi:predicted Zn-dependent peptidase
MSSIKMTELENGLRVITDNVPGMDSVALGIWAGVGTRHEDMVNNGCAHMVEHMLFKGTEKRSALEIAEVIENVGGNMNAYTGREVTSYHAHVLKEDTDLAIDVIADMAQNYTMPQEEIERERSVILQEIGMCNDTPDDLIFDEYQETAYPEQSLGAPILGRAEYIEGMKREALQDYITQFYTPSRIVVSAAGGVDHEAFAARVAKQFDNLPEDKPHHETPANYSGGENRNEKALEQSHVILGFQGISRLEEDFYAAQALSSLLGGGMSSRLFQEVREKRGLVYSIFSFHAGYQDDGQFGIYAGTGPELLTDLIPVICDEVQKATADITEVEMARAKAQMKASLLMGRESMMNRADRQAKNLLQRGEVIDMDAVTAKIEALDIAKVQGVASRIFTGKPTVAGLGPLSQMESYDSICGRINQKLAA